MSDSENEFLRSQLEITREVLAKAQEEVDFLKNRLILEQIERAFSKAGGSSDIESDQVRGMLRMLGDVELAGGEVGFRRKGSKELATLAEAMELMKKSAALAPIFSPQPQATPEEKIFKNEFGSFRKV